MTIAALFVQKNGIYSKLPDIDLWDVSRDARLYAGPHKVTAHPDCKRWGKYYSGGPSHAGRFKLGDDNGCFASALASVRLYSGVLEHPKGSKAWDAFGLRKPPSCGGWVGSAEDGWTCEVYQGHYGHDCPKATWLYFVGEQKPPELIWGKSTVCKAVMDRSGGAKGRAAHKALKAAGLKYMSKNKRAATPKAFAELLIKLVSSY